MIVLIQIEVSNLSKIFELGHLIAAGNWFVVARDLGEIGGTPCGQGDGAANLIAEQLNAIKLVLRRLW